MKELMFTPGPTEIPPKVLRAMSRQILNPDIDERFFDFYDSTCNKIRKMAGTKSTVFIMAGEGMLALDAAVGNLEEPNDQVLAISSGFFGDGFVDLVKNYRGKPAKVSTAYNDVVTPNSVERELERNPKIRIATFVHCETPSGTIAPLEEIGKICNDHDVILVADTVSTIGALPINADKNHIDACLAASQKCFSAPPGLAIISISKRAWEKIDARKSKVESYYLDLSMWKDTWIKDRLFPYTQSVSDIFALDKALDLMLEEGLGSVEKRHSKVANFVRESCEELGLKLFPARPEICSDTVTALRVPSGVKDSALRERMQRKHGVMIAGSWGKLSGKVIRLGHMGYNAKMEKARRAIYALSESLKSAGF